MITVKFEGGDCLELSIETFVGAHLKGISFHRAIFEGLDFSGKMGSWKNGVRPLFFWRSTKRGLTPIFPRGASFATEFDPKTGSTRQWMESYDHAGEVIRVHPKSINGQTVDAQHYPPTGAELKSWGQQ